MTQAEQGNFEDPEETQKLTDPLDVATDQAMRFNDAAVRDARKLAQQDQMPDSEGNYFQYECDDCGDDIGEERLKVAPRNLLCVFCAAKAERKR